MNTSILGIDLGTSAIKGALLSRSGTVLATYTRFTEIERPGPGQVVFSSERCYEILCDVFRTLAQAAPAGSIQAVALSGATGDTLLLSREGRPLLPTIHWMDTRSADDTTVDPPGMTAADIYRISGWPWFRRFPLAQLAWLKQHQAEVFHQADRVGMNLTYQYFRLCGAWAMDPSTATTFYLQDQPHQTWYQPYVDGLGLKAAQLPLLLPSGHRIGRISGTAAAETGLPEGCSVVLGAFDHPSAARGAGITQPGELLLSLGTSWVGFYPITERAVALNQKMLVDPFLSGENGAWGGMFSLTQAGEKLNAAFLASYPDAPDAETRYTLIEHDLRQMMNGVAPTSAATTMVRDLVESMHERIKEYSQQGIPVRRIVLVGGPSANPAIVDLFRQTLGKPTQVAPTAGYTGAVGAAFLASKGVEQ